jgi:hypothetical protein
MTARPSRGLCFIEDSGKPPPRRTLGEVAKNQTLRETVTIVDGGLVRRVAEPLQNERLDLLECGTNPEIFEGALEHSAGAISVVVIN